MDRELINFINSGGGSTAALGLWQADQHKKTGNDRALIKWYAISPDAQCSTCPNFVLICSPISGFVSI
ncbi:MAG: hypothetical protein HC827_12505 [Cyanobacteria bacterium RM1_2_2]|nr:hypothetical protein [Cyanobacteria bacterium RM1_2_2]